MTAPLPAGGTGPTMTPAQYLATMGAAFYCPALRQRLKPGMLTVAMGFDKLVSLAERRGFTERRLLKAALRTGRVGAAAMARCEAVVALLQPDELMREVALASCHAGPPAAAWPRPNAKHKDAGNSSLAEPASAKAKHQRGAAAQVDCLPPASTPPAAPPKEKGPGSLHPRGQGQPRPSL